MVSARTDAIHRHLPSIPERAGLVRNRSRALLAVELTEFRMTVAAIGDEKRHQGTHAVYVGAIDDRPSVPRAADEPRARQDCDMRRERVRRTSRRLRRWPQRAARRARAASASERSQVASADLTPLVRRAHAEPTSSRPPQPARRGSQPQVRLLASWLPHQFLNRRADIPPSFWYRIFPEYQKYHDST